MSVKLMGLVFDLDLPRPEAWVLMALVDHAEHDGTRIFPSVAYVAWKTGYKRRQIQAILKRLRERGVLVRIAAARDHRPCEYRADFSKAPRKPDRSATIAPRPRDRGASAPARRGVQPRAQRGATATAPEPSVEPSREPSVGRPVLNDREKGDPNGTGAADVASPEELVATYHELCGDLPRVRALTATLRHRGARALRAHSLPFWQEVFTKAAASDFLTGRSGRGWRATFDWLLGGKPDDIPNADKILEGTFDNNGTPGRSRTATSAYRDFPRHSGATR